MRPNWFIAFPIKAPEELLERLDPCHTHINAFAPQDLHITASFLGAVSENTARESWTHACSIRPKVLTCKTGDPVLLGPKERPWAVCASIVDQQVISTITSLRNPCRKHIGLSPETRPVVAHCTVGAIERDLSSAQRQSAEQWARSLQTSGLVRTLDTVALYTWSEDRERSQFRIVESCSLR